MVVVLGTCRMCLRDADLIDSHIIPAWAWKRARADTLANAHPVAVSAGVAMQSPKQIHEHLFCRPCEDRLKVGEDYAANVTYQRDHTAPFLDLIGGVVEVHDRVRLVEPGRLDTALLAYFGVSVIWRASLSTEINTCSLGAVHDESIRRYLLGETPLPDDVACCVAFHDLPYADRTHIASIFVTPVTERNGVTRFLFYGLQYYVATGEDADVWKTWCVVHRPEHWVVLAPQEHLINWLGPWLKRARQVGTLTKLHGI